MLLVILLFRLNSEGEGHLVAPLHIRRFNVFGDLVKRAEVQDLVVHEVDADAEEVVRERLRLLSVHEELLYGRRRRQRQERRLGGVVKGVVLSVLRRVAELIRAATADELAPRGRVVLLVAVEGVQVDVLVLGVRSVGVVTGCLHKLVLDFDY